MSHVFNLVLLIIIGLVTLGGVKHGLRRELLNIAGVIVAFVGGIFLAKPVGLLFRQFGVLEDVPYLLAFATGFLLASLGFSILKAPFRPKETDLAERISGGLVGFGKGLVAAALVVYLMAGIWPSSVRAVADAPVARFVMPIAKLIDRAVGAAHVVLPSEFTDRVRDGFDALRDTLSGFDEAFETLEEAGETAREYQERAGEGAAIADSLARTIVPPPDAGVK